MSIRHFEQSTRNRELIELNLKDSGFESLKDVIDAKKDIFGKIDYTINHSSFDKLLQFLQEDKKHSNNEAIEHFRDAKNSIEKLKILSTMSLQDTIICIRNYSDSDAPYHYLERRLDFYQKFFQGIATRTREVEVWDQKKCEYKRVIEEYKIENTDVSPEKIRLGILRDSLFAVMIGTPELGIFKVVEKRLKNKNIPSTHMPLLKGYHSGIHDGSIGFAYPFLRELYENARGQVRHNVGERKIDEQALEHTSVILAANWLEEAMNYNAPGRTPHSCYSGSLEEAVAWARLGDGVKKQLRGMRQKIQGVNLSHIGRFIGKSGIDKYDAEHKRLFSQIKFLKEGYDQDKKQEFTTKENGFAINKQQKWYESELERLNHKFEKSKAQIEKLDLPYQERQLQLQSVTIRHEETCAYLQLDCDEKFTHLNERTPSQLLVDLEQRQIIVNKRHEKRKSLAQKALDLHFSINHTGGDNDSKPLANLIDWINSAPLGTIKRAHKMLRQNVGEEAITTYALADIITGARGVTQGDLKIIKDLVKKVKEQDYTVFHTLKNMSEVGNIISLFDYEVSLAEVKDIASKGFYGLKKALRMYDLKQVKQFIDKGIDLKSVTTGRKITQKFGHDLSPDQIAEIAGHNVDGLESAMNTFDLDGVTTLLKQDVHLPTAVIIVNITKKFGYTLEVPQITKIAKNIHDMNDFTSALRGLPLEKVEKLFAVGISYNDFSTVKAALVKHHSPSDFNASLTMAQKLAKHSEYGNLDDALKFYSLQEVEQIIAKGVTLSGMLEIRQSLEEKQVATTLQETILFGQYAGGSSQGWILARCIDAFGIENVRKMAFKSCYFYQALNVNDYLNRKNQSSDNNSESENNVSNTVREALRKGSIDVIIAIAKAGSIEAAIKTLAAGFTLEEITRFPYLISSLVAKPQL